MNHPIQYVLKPEAEIPARSLIAFLRQNPDYIRERMHYPAPLQIWGFGACITLDEPEDREELLRWLDAEVARLESLPVPRPPMLKLWQVAA